MIRRHDLAGPRYTSYPTAPQFREDFSSAELEQAINRSNQSQRPLSLYFHIPFCDTICYYCGCNKIITANKKRAQPYLNTLYQEIQRTAKLVDSDRPVKQLHWGGGTPTYISDEQKTELMAQTRKHFRFIDEGEYSIELHPGNTDVDTIDTLRKLGFNRLSMGVQDFDEQVQNAVNRFNSPAEVAELVSRARLLGFDSISFDLIYGLPFQTLRTISTTLDRVIEINPDRLSLFNYAHLPHLFKSQKQMDASALPAAEAKLAMLELAIDRLQQAGYVYIGMDHFAKPSDELCKAQEHGTLQRNFQGYATHGNCDMFSFGVSSISCIDNIYVQNHKQIPPYTQAIEDQKWAFNKGMTLSQDDLLRQFIINRLICQFELNFASVEERFGINFNQYFSGELTQLQPLLTDGLLTELNHRGLVVSQAGRLLIRRICMEFDAYLPGAKQSLIIASESQSHRPSYSKII